MGFLEEALKNTTIIKVQESITLQKDYHARQRELLKIKKCQYEKYKKAINHQKQTNQQHFTQIADNIETSNDLQIAIVKNMEQSDNLLEDLVKKEGTEESKSSPIADELKNLNAQLHILVYKLTSQMDECINENESLKSAIKKEETNKQITSSPLEEYKTDVTVEQDLPPLELPLFDFDDKNNK